MPLYTFEPVWSIEWSWNQKKLCFSRSSLPAGQFRYSCRPTASARSRDAFGPYSML